MRRSADVSTSHHSRTSSVPLLRSHCTCRSIEPLRRGWNRRSDRPRHTWFRTVESDLAPLDISMTTVYIVERRIVKPRARSWGRQRSTSNKPHDDDDDVHGATCLGTSLGHSVYQFSGHISLFFSPLYSTRALTV